MTDTRRAATRQVPITRPTLGDAEAAAVAEVIASGWLVQGPKVEEFERLFSAFTGAAHSVASTSCTTALHLALAAIDVKPGQEVIVPAFTWVATANAVEYFGARPVFVDIDPTTFNVDIERLAGAITDRTAGIIPVHLFGLCADMDRVMELARARALWVVEDAACAFGAGIGERHAGTFGDAAAFSFHPRKAITTGEGGMLTTGDSEMAKIARSLRDHGADRTDLDRHTASDGTHLPAYPRLGFNYRMTDLQAAIGVVQMGRAEHLLETRRHQARRYDAALESMDLLTAPATPAGYTHGYQSYVAWFGREAWRAGDVEGVSRRRNRYMGALQDRGIATRQGTHAAALQDYYRARYATQPSQFPMAHAAERLTISLPMFATMTDEEQDYVIDSLGQLATTD